MVSMAVVFLILQYRPCLVLSVPNLWASERSWAVGGSVCIGRWERTEKQRRHLNPERCLHWSEEKTVLKQFLKIESFTTFAVLRGVSSLSSHRAHLEYTEYNRKKVSGSLYAMGEQHQRRRTIHHGILNCITRHTNPRLREERRDHTLIVDCGGISNRTRQPTKFGASRWNFSIIIMATHTPWRHWY
jgi:hypothetical protein